MRLEVCFNEAGLFAYVSNHSSLSLLKFMLFANAVWVSRVRYLTWAGEHLGGGPVSSNCLFSWWGCSHLPTCDSPVLWYEPVNWNNTGLGSTWQPTPKLQLTNNVRCAKIRKYTICWSVNHCTNLRKTTYEHGLQLLSRVETAEPYWEGHHMRRHLAGLSHLLEFGADGSPWLRRRFATPSFCFSFAVVLCLIPS